MTPCAEFAGAIQTTGYGAKWYKGKVVGAHRLAYALHHGLDVFTMGGVVMHSCDNPACVNVEHLSLDTQKANRADCVNKGRANALSGAQAPAAKLTQEQAQEIRARYVRGDTKLLAQEYGISRAIVGQIVRNETYL